ncbi:MAG: sugar ABC transporter substrate-binding protein [Clostridiales Family XIII bacterium]|jgi:ABC-type sugar transport system substrate-binding protein|nr:sugar ABC transporter substrate-binding protein [Clostridiales Family XIII bacterium]
MERKKLFKSLLLVLALLVAVAMIAGCTKTADDSSTAGDATEQTDTADTADTTATGGEEAADSGSGGVTKIGISLDNLDDPYWVGLKMGLDQALEEIGSDKVQADVQVCQGDANLQAKQIQDMLAAGANAIVCVYVDNEAIKQSIKLCNEKGVPFVYADRPVDSSDDAKVAWGMNTDDYELSKQGWEWMVDYAKKNNIEKLNVLELVGSLTDANVLKRTNGFEDVMKANPDLIERVQSVPTEWNIEKAASGVTNALQANPEINCIFMHSDVLLAPTIQSLETADRWKKTGEDGHVIVMPYSGNSTSLDSVKDGYVEMCFGMNTIKIGHDAVMAAYEIANGDTSTYSTPVADPGFLITTDNFDETSKMAYGFSGMKK